MCPTRTITPDAVGRVHSPEYGGNYGVNLNCKLTLDVPSDKKVEVMYNYRDIECKYMKFFLCCRCCCCCCCCLLLAVIVASVAVIFVFVVAVAVTFVVLFVVVVVKAAITVLATLPFPLTDSPQCWKDKLLVADKTTSFYTCGTSSDANPQTYNGDVSFNFTTDSSGSGRGFILTYKLVNESVKGMYKFTAFWSWQNNKEFTNGMILKKLSWCFCLLVLLLQVALGQFPSCLSIFPQFCFPLFCLFRQNH